MGFENCWGSELDRKLAIFFHIRYHQLGHLFGEIWNPVGKVGWKLSQKGKSGIRR